MIYVLFMAITTIHGDTSRFDSDHQRVIERRVESREACEQGVIEARKMIGVYATCLGVTPR